jgi:small-conductance mechanosensitive channel
MKVIPVFPRRWFLRQWLQRISLWLAALLCVLNMALPGVSQDLPISGNQVDGFPVTLGDQTLFLVREGIPGVVSVEERAEIISDRLLSIANNSDIPLDAIQAMPDGDVDVVRANDLVIFTILEADREAATLSFDSRAEMRDAVVQFLRESIQTYREDRSAKRLLQGAVFAVLSTVVTILWLRFLFEGSGKLILYIQRLAELQSPETRGRVWQILGPRLTTYLLVRLIRLIRLILVLAILYIYLPFVLSQFPVTRRFGQNILSDILKQVGVFGQAFADYLPNLISLVLLSILTYYLVGWVQQVIAELGREDAYPWFYPEWVQPTNRLATLFLVAIALVIGSPYLPGFGSPAFQGVSIFFGALITLGSSSAVANAVAGIILIYTRAFRIGDMIRIGEIFGQVKEKSLFVTRLMTSKKEIVTVPNATVLSGNVINYSAITYEPNSYLILYTTITLGYDVPWRKVHEVLVNAALATEEIVPAPAPFVLQTGLNDFHISYELNAYTKFPGPFARIYSQLHQNIQDFCNQADIEILSPAFTALRDGNHSTIPENYLPKDYESPGFRIHSQPQN